MLMNRTRAEDGSVTLVHGMDGQEQPPDWPALQTAEIETLAAGFAQLRSPVIIEWHSPRPFSAAALVRTGSGEFFVKRHSSRVRDTASLEEEHRFIAHLRSHLRAHAVSVCEPLIDSSGRSAWSAHGSCYEVHALAPGVDAYRAVHSWTPARSAQHAQAMGAALARLHLAAQGYDAPARAPRPLLAGVEIIGATDLAGALTHFVRVRPDLARFLVRQDPDWHAAIMRAIGPAHAHLRPLWSALAPLWVHNDWHASNLFWTDRSAQAEVRAVIDFGLCNLGCAVADLATALERNTIAWLEYKDTAPETHSSIGRPELALALLDGYIRVRPLSSAEREALPHLLSLAHVEFALAEAQYFDGIVGNAHNAALAYPKFLLGHVNWLQSRHGREYLDAVRDWLRTPLE